MAARRASRGATLLCGLVAASASCGTSAVGDSTASGGVPAATGGTIGTSSGGAALGGLNSGGGSSHGGSGNGGADARGGMAAGGAAMPSTGGNGAAGVAGSLTGTGGSTSPNSGGSSGGGASGTSTTAGGSSGAGGASRGGSSGAAGTSTTAGNAGTGGKSGSTCAPAAGPLIGWAAVAGNSVTTTIGGDGGATVVVRDLAALQNAAKGSGAQIIQIEGTISGEVSVGSNKTLLGCQGAVLKGRLALNGSVNVIVRNLKIVGNNCSESPSDCSDGNDVITVQSSAHHLWFDHDDISDGSDGNLDLTHAADYVTISWTKFHYSGRRAGGHQFSNLVGHDDDNSKEDTGHLRMTFHHNWWADNVAERMPRVRFGQVHLFNNLYTASGNNYCVGIGVGANVLTENNVFSGVKTPINGTSYSDGASAVKSLGNVYTNTTGDKPEDLRPGSVFSPPYSYSAEPTAGLEAAIRAAAGPR